MKSTQRGQLAEAAVADLLAEQGYKIIERNWRRPRCEIDLIARKGSIIYFVEVKYRAQAEQGDGFDYVTAAKQKQMHFAASLWAQEKDYDGDFRLMAASVSGPACENIQLTEV